MCSRNLSEVTLSTFWKSNKIGVRYLYSIDFCKNVSEVMKCQPACPHVVKSEKIGVNQLDYICAVNSFCLCCFCFDINESQKVKQMFVLRL